jgi:hypothetical protein
MTRSLERICWILAALIAAGFFLLAGYYGWASLAIWTLLVLPLVLRKRRQLSASGHSWPATPVLLAWASGVAVSFFAGLGPLLVSAGSTLVGLAIAAFSWIGAALSLGVIALVTYDNVVRKTGAA